MRCTVLDLGSNTFHVLVADVDGFGIRNVIFDRKIAVRIGDQAFATGHIPAAAYARGLEAVESLLIAASLYTSGPCRIVATEVFRKTSNGAAFIAEATERAEVPIEVIEGSEEARLTWRAVSAELAGSHGRLAVIDVGGGSLQYMHGVNTVERAHSVPLGVLRMRAMSADEVRAHVSGHAVAFAADLPGVVDTVAISSGTARALLRLARDLNLISADQRHLWCRTITDVARIIAPLSPAALVDLGVDAARADTLVGGVLTLEAMLEPLSRPVAYVARSGLREGVLIEMASRDPRRAAAL